MHTPQADGVVNMKKYLNTVQNLKRFSVKAKWENPDPVKACSEHISIGLLEFNCIFEILKHNGRTRLVNTGNANTFAHQFAALNRSMFDKKEQI